MGRLGWRTALEMPMLWVMVWKLTRGSVAALAVACLSLALAGAAVAAPAQPAQPKVALSSLEQGVLADINVFRVLHNLAPLRLSASLTASARAHSQEMAAQGYFAHESADGSAFWKRIKAVYPQGPFHYWAVGENLLWSSPDVDAQGALQLGHAGPGRYTVTAALLVIGKPAGFTKRELVVGPAR